MKNKVLEQIAGSYDGIPKRQKPDERCACQSGKTFRECCQRKSVVSPIKGSQRWKPNDPCRCGSGKKFKKCCHKKQIDQQNEQLKKDQQQKAINSTIENFRSQFPIAAIKEHIDIVRVSDSMRIRMKPAKDSVFMAVYYVQNGQYAFIPAVKFDMNWETGEFTCEGSDVGQLMFVAYDEFGKERSPEELKEALIAQKKKAEEMQEAV